MRELTGRAEVLDATRASEYARFATAMASDLVGYAVDDGVLWLGVGPFGRLAHAVGSEPAVDRLIATVRERGQLRADWFNVPRRVRPPAGFEVREQWDFRWSTGDPPPVPEEERVREIDDAPALEALLDVAMPGGHLRPGHPLVRHWYGIWADGQLVACAADRSTRTDDPGVAVVGVIGAVAVHPEHRRHGYGAAVSAALTRRLRAEHELVTLGVVDGNDGAARIYHRLGYTGVAHITSLWVQ